MSKQDSVTTASGWRRVERWIDQRTAATGGQTTDAPPLADAEVIARWTSVSEMRHGHRRFNPLWRNGLRHEAIRIRECIWRTMRGQQTHISREGIPWPVESALWGLHVAACRDWDDIGVP